MQMLFNSSVTNLFSDKEKKAYLKISIFVIIYH